MGNLTPLKFLGGSKVVAAFLYLHVIGSCCAQQIVKQEERPQTTPVVHGTASVAPGGPPRLPDAPTLPSLASPAVDLEEQGHDPQNNAIAAAVADGVTTGLALSAGGVEANALISTTPLGLVALTAMKIGLVKYADTFPEQEKRTTLKTASTVWGGAAINNLMILVAAPPPFPIVAGMIAGFATWIHVEGRFRQEDERIAARNRKNWKIVGNNGTISTHTVETSGN